MRVVSWNVNGIRACVRHGFVDFVDRSGADIVGVQEVRARPKDIPPATRWPMVIDISYFPGIDYPGRDDTSLKGVGSHLTSRVTTIGPWRLHPLSSMTIVRPFGLLGRSFRERRPPKRPSCVDTKSCLRSLVRRRRSTNPSKWMSSKLCNGSSSIAADSGNFGTPMFSVRKTETARAFICELDKTAAGKSHSFSTSGSLTTVCSSPLPLTT